ncbi:MAG: restriction endonuclease subunit S [Myxococcales bacterium]|nr:restriction endonuclease subunit S [Myxococcales bacterium]
MRELVSEGLLALNDGYRVTNAELGKSGTPFVRGGDIGTDGEIDTNVVDHVREEFTDRIRAKLSATGDVAFITKGTVGRVGFIRKDQPNVVFAPQVCYWRSLNPARIDSRFLYYLLKGADFQANLSAVKTHGSMAADYVSLTDQQSFLLTLPPPDEQRAIAHILGTLDDKIELNRRTNETLEAMARALFKSWFVDFDPVHAKKAGRKPEGMDAETAALFPDDFEDSEMGKIPRGWKAVPLDTIADFLNGLALQKFPAAPGEPSLPVIKIAQLRKGAVDGADRASRSVPMQYVVKDGDLLFSWSGTLEVAVWCGGEGALNQHLFKVTSKTTPPWFYHGWLLHHLADFRQIAADKATTMGHIQRGHLTRAIVALPSGKTLQSGGAALASLAARSLSVRKNSQTIAALRDALLPQLLSGSLRVPEAMRLVEKAL